MDYGRPALADLLAASYALGTLRGSARRRFESLLPAHPALRDANRLWQERLMPLSLSLTPVEPSPSVWRRVEARISGAAATSPAVASRSAPGLAFWRGLAGFASVAALTLAVLVALPQDVRPPVVVVLAATSESGAGALTPSIVASISGDGRALVAKPIVPVAVRADRALELWAIPPGGKPRSLGVMPGEGGTMALPAKVISGTDTLAVTIEAPGGSPSGAPTTPPVYVGKFTL